MAEGDVSIFNSFIDDLGNGEHDIGGSDVIKIGLVTSSAAPDIDLATPTWSDFNANECTAGGNYTAEGNTVGSVTWTVDQGNDHTVFDAADVTIATNASNPTDARWAILYNDTAASDQAIGFVDLGAVIDLTAGDFAIAWGANGICRIGLGTLS